MQKTFPSLPALDIIPSWLYNTIAKAKEELRMNYSILDMSTYSRKAHFEYFSSFANPYAGLTVQADITPLYKAVKADKAPFFLSILFAATSAANSVPELRRRVKDGSIIEYERCRPSFTLALNDDTYCYCTVNAPADDLCSFIEDGRHQQELAKAEQNLSDSEDDGDLLFISCLPWQSYTSLTQPTPSPADYNPRITWGKAYEHDGKFLLPLTLLVNHALADGLHIARFFDAFSNCIQNTFNSL